MNQQFGNIAYFAVAIGLFVYARTLSGGSATVPETAVAPATAQTSQPVAVAATPLPAPAPAPVVAVAAPVAPAPTPAPVQPAPAPVRPAPAPVKPAPAPVKPAPAPAPPPSLAKPQPLNTNPDDAPARTNSGKVQSSGDVSLPPAYGPVDAPVHVVIFSDFQCPVCRRAGDATHQIAEEFPGQVRMEFWQHALEMHRNAANAAAASLAAHRQGKFWPYHDTLFRNQGALDEVSLGVYAEQLGLDMAKFRADYKDPALRARLKREGAFADALGARGTPAFMVNGKLSVGWGSWNGFRGQVERELGKTKQAVADAGGDALKAREARAKANIENPEHFQQYLNLALNPLAAAAKKK